MKIFKYKIHYTQICSFFLFLFVKFEYYSQQIKPNVQLKNKS